MFIKSGHINCLIGLSSCMSLSKSYTTLQRRGFYVVCCIGVLLSCLCWKEALDAADVTSDCETCAGSVGCCRCDWRAQLGRVHCTHICWGHEVKHLMMTAVAVGSFSVRSTGHLLHQALHLLHGRCMACACLSPVQQLSLEAVLEHAPYGLPS